MNNRIMRPGEVATVSVNLRAIEKELGRPIPAGFLDVSRYSDHILTPGEILTICRNINSIAPYNHDYRVRVTEGGTSAVGALLGTILIVAAVLAAGAFLKSFFGVTIL